METVRSFLYPLGFVASLLFGLRIFVQWWTSEKKRASSVSKSFWILSLIANGIMALHGFIQLQYPVCAIQATNGIIAWRNLDLMRPKHHSLPAVLLRTGFVLAFISSLFLLESLLSGSFIWMRIPTLPWNNVVHAPIDRLWHLVGFFGMVLFSSRFWVQWWCIEKKRQSYLGSTFWWISLFGASFSFTYFFKLHDPVHILGYGIGLVPYIRNLMLIYKHE